MSGLLSNRQVARDAARTANDRAGEALTETYPATMALVAIAYAVLDAADAMREAADAARALERRLP